MLTRQSPGSQWVTPGEPDEKVRTFGFALEIGAPVARAVGAFAYLGVGSLFGRPDGAGRAEEGAPPRPAVTKRLRPCRLSRHNAALLISGSLAARQGTSLGRIFGFSVSWKRDLNLEPLPERWRISIQATCGNGSHCVFGNS